MKVSISFKPEESAKAQTIANLVKAALVPARVHNAGQKNGYLHIYINTKQLANNRSE